VVAAAAQEAVRGRERLRELVQKARAGDVEARNLLSARRRKVARNRDGANAQTARQPVSAAREEQPTRSSIRQQASRRLRPSNRQRSRPIAPEPVVATTEVPQLPVTLQPVATTIATEVVDLTPAKVVPSLFQPAQFGDQPQSEITREEAQLQVVEATVAPIELAPEEPAHVDLTPTNTIPSLFQPAQFGTGGRGVQARTSITRQQQIFEPQTHQVLHRGLESGSRNEALAHRGNVIPDPERERQPPILATRRYAYFDEAGNYIFGYEAEDGSFKEEIRGLDCIVHGKYGYVDPSGIRREFTYVSGNKCDPNDPEGLLAQEGVTIPPNDQFLHQTDARQMSDDELSSIKFNMRRKNVNVRQRQQQPRVPAAERTAPARQRVSRPVVQQTRTDNQRFPVPDFLNRGQVEQARSVPRPTLAPTTEAPTTIPPPTQAPRRPSQPAVPDLTPTRVVPSIFQPAQFGAGGRGVPAPAGQFNFEKEFSNVFDHFDTRGPQTTLRSVRPTQPPTTTSPPPPRPTAQPQVPALFRPAQHGDPRPAPPPLDAGSDFTLTPKQPVQQQPTQQSIGFNQLVFDANSGQFKTITVQGGAPAPTPVNPAPPRPVPAPAPKPIAGRVLPSFSSGSNSPLRSIPTNAAEFDQFFSHFRG